VNGKRMADFGAQEEPTPEPDDAPMETRTVRLPGALLSEIERIATKCAAITGKRPKLSETVRYLVGVGIWAIDSGVWHIEAEPSDKLRHP